MAGPTVTQIIQDAQRGLDSGASNANNPLVEITENVINLGDFVVDVSLQHWARQILVLVSGRGFRPSTDYYRLYWGLDNPLDQLGTEIIFGDYVNPAGEPIGISQNFDQYIGSTYVDTDLPEGKQTIQFIKTDANGDFSCGIYVPAGTPIGDSIVECVNESDIFAGIGGLDSRGNTVYRAFGVHQQKDPIIITTQTIDIPDTWNPPPPPTLPPPLPPPTPQGGTVCDGEYLAADVPSGEVFVSEDDQGTTVARFVPIPGTSPKKVKAKCMRISLDPLAQSFFTYNQPVYISGIDLYFQTKPSTASAVTVQIREMINGFPGPKIIPGSTVTLNPSDVTISTDATEATSFTYSDPVYLESNTEYCFVVLAFTTGYEVWTSELGQKDVITGYVIDKQPVLGSLFTSQNNRTWTPEQNFDLKFKIKSCSFSTDGTNEYVNFGAMTGANAFAFIEKVSQLTLMSTQIVHPNTSIRWFYKFDQTSPGPTSTSQGVTNDWRLFEPGINLDLQNLTAQVLLRMEYQGGSLSPVIDKERLGVVFLKNKPSGTYISKAMEFSAIEPENLKPNVLRINFDAYIPSNTTVTPYCAIDDDIKGYATTNWREICEINSSTVSPESVTDTFTVNFANNVLILDNGTDGFYTGKPFTLNSTNSISGIGLTVGNTYYAIVVSNTRIKVATSEINALSGTATSLIDDGKTGSITRHSHANVKTYAMPGGITQYDITYDLRGALNELDRDGVNLFKFRLDLAAEDGYEYVSPLIYGLRIHALKKI